MSRKALVVGGALVLLVMSGLTMALPLANAQSSVIVKIPSGAGSGVSAAPGFSPENVTVMIGVNNTVIWENNDTVAGKGTAHTVVVKTQPTGGNMPTTGSGNIPVNTSYTFTFTVPGTYIYYCSYHSWMAGSVVVLASTSTSTSTHTTPEFPAAYLAVILFAVIAAVILVAPRLRPRLPAATGTTPSRPASTSS